MNYKDQDWFTSLSSKKQEEVSKCIDAIMWRYEQDLNWRLEQLCRPLDEEQLKQWYGQSD